MNVELLIAFVAASLALAPIPGPAMLYIAAQSLGGGRGAGVRAALGIHVGGWVHVALAAAGLSAALRLVPDLYLGLKLAGAAYLVWIGIGLLRHAGQGVEAAAPRSARRAFLDSMTVQLLNPKVALFFLAFLPQFTDPGAAWPLAVQMLVLGAILNMIFLGFDLLVAFGTGSLGAALRARRWLERIAGALLIGLGARLALDRS
jgi:threonine/homoserine/homoserine lactone efflux protein